MPTPARLFLDSSSAALALVNARKRGELPGRPWMPVPTPPLPGGSSSAMPIQFAPESEPTANVVDLNDGQATGPLPLGFEFEVFGERYTWFDLSPDGFLIFGTRSVVVRSHGEPGGRFIPLNAKLSNFVALGWTDVRPRGRGHVAYEVRGAPHRRRLVLSFTSVPPHPGDDRGMMHAQVVLHERTGLIDVHTTRRSPVAASGITREAVRFTTASPSAHVLSA